MRRELVASILFTGKPKRIGSMNIPNIRLLNQQLVASQFTDVHDLISHVGMLQAQEYRMMRWAVGIRMKRPSMAAFRSAYNSGRIVRTHLFRCTWQLVAAEDLRWMLKLCADRNKAAINGYTAYQGRVISEDEYNRANSLIWQALAGRRSTTKTELVERLAELGLSDTVHAMSIFLRRAELDGIICSGELDSKENTYALIDERIPPAAEPSCEEAVVMLARKYFRSHSPATLEDFVWWTNLKPANAVRLSVRSATNLWKKSMAAQYTTSTGIAACEAVAGRRSCCRRMTNTCSATRVATMYSRMSSVRVRTATTACFTP